MVANASGSGHKLRGYTKQLQSPSSGARLLDMWMRSENILIKSNIKKRHPLHDRMKTKLGRKKRQYTSFMQYPGVSLGNHKKQTVRTAGLRFYNRTSHLWNTSLEYYTPKAVLTGDKIWWDMTTKRKSPSLSECVSKYQNYIEYL
jgi:hypothetical protein